MQNVIPGSIIAPCTTNRECNDGDNKDVSSKGVETCYAFKSRLQEYAQKIGIPTPVYYTVKEGPSHQPVFKSTVTVNDVAYESLPGFSNRKTAEQSAAEVALIEIYKSGQMVESIPTVHESGLCKNLLQEYAQKMNYAIPVYKIRRLNDSANPFICTVDIGGIQYIGTAARTKKEAEIKVARTALLAIQNSSKYDNSSSSQYTVLPGKKDKEIPDRLKPKKQKTKKKWQKRKFPRKNKSEGQTVDPGNVGEGQTVDPSNISNGQTVSCGNNADGQIVNLGNTENCQTVNPGNIGNGHTVKPGNICDGQTVTVNPRNNVDGQNSENNVNGQCVSTGNNVDGQSTNTGNNDESQSCHFDCPSFNSSSNVDGQHIQSGNKVDGQSVNLGSNVDGQSVNAGNSISGQSVNPDYHVDDRSVNASSNDDGQSVDPGNIVHDQIVSPSKNNVDVLMI